MIELPWIEVMGHWLAIFLTFCILSFLYKDNPFYKFAEHLFIGVSIGYVSTQQYYNVLRPKLIERIGAADYWYANWDLIALALTMCMFVKTISARWSWVGRYPLAFIIALYAGLQIVGVTQADLGQQIKRATRSLDASKIDINTADREELARLPGVSPMVAEAIVTERAKEPFTSIDQIAHIETLSAAERDLLAGARGSVTGLDAQATVAGAGKYWFGIFSNLLLLLGLIAALVYFYFSIAHRGAIGVVSRFGVWILMIGFGASFGFTVQGRIALAIGRAQYVLGRKLEAAQREQVMGWLVALISITIITVGIALWERRQKRGSDATDAESISDS
ncbi:MAG: helix-hairpin-helix domain-containing protein [Proteobacteria bacterium]|nr:helix-hairpin-helix domain-containing protein [Pseudomonadota bacterium]